MKGVLTVLCLLLGLFGQSTFAAPQDDLGNGLCVGKRNLMSDREFERRKQECENHHRKHWHWRRTRERKVRECIDGVEHERLATSKSYLHCCTGYVKVQGSCKPACQPNCVQGECVAPNRCECAVNFSGPTCNETCSPGRFGTNCEFDCARLLHSDLNSYLDPHLNPHHPNQSRCSCSSTEPTSDQCRQICKCKWPSCKPGRVGILCDQRCPAGTYGNFCQRNCTCNLENTLECSPEDGRCICRSPYDGANCEDEQNDSQPNAFQLVLSSLAGNWVLMFVCLSIGCFALLAVYCCYRREANTPLKFLAARYSKTEAPNDSIYHIGTLPCTNKLRDGKFLNVPQDKLDGDGKILEVRQDKLGGGKFMDSQDKLGLENLTIDEGLAACENLYESIDNFE